METGSWVETSASALEKGCPRPAPPLSGVLTVNGQKCCFPFTLVLKKRVYQGRPGRDLGWCRAWDPLSLVSGDPEMPKKRPYICCAGRAPGLWGGCGVWVMAT